MRTTSFGFLRTLMAVATALAACSSSSGGGGASGSSGGKSNDDAGASAQPGANGGVPVGSPATGENACAPEAGDAACLACLKQSCCDALSACENDSECVAFFSCANPCTDAACVTACQQAHPNAEAHARAVVSCVDSTCASSCSPSGSSSTPDGGDQCLPDSTVPAGAPDCQGVPNLPRERDCPYGSPDTACVPAPNGLTNVFCCPPA